MGLTDHTGCPKLECGQHYALFQEHNRYGPCNCGFCKGAALIPIYQKNWEQKYMSTLNICDRCETPATSNAMGSFTKRLSLRHNVESLELCPGCVSDFVEFMAGSGFGDVTSQNRPKAYKEPYTEQDDTDESFKTRLRELLAPKDDVHDEDDW